MSDDQEKRWFRQDPSGERGYLYEEDGETYMRLNRPMEKILKPLPKDKNGKVAFDAKGAVAGWRPDDTVGKLLASQVAQIAFAADREYCRFIGKFEQARKTWDGLTDRERSDFIRNGPLMKEHDPVREDLWRSVVAAVPAQG